MPWAKAAESRTGTNIPVTPSTTGSAQPGTRVATTGRPIADASSRATLKPSRYDGFDQQINGCQMPRHILPHPGQMNPRVGAKKFFVRRIKRVLRFERTDDQQV